MLSTASSSSYSNLARAYNRSISGAFVQLSTFNQGASSSTRRRPKYAAASPPASNIVRSHNFSVCSSLKNDSPATKLPSVAQNDPELYTAVRPQPRSSYAALAYRLKLVSHSMDPQSRHRLIDLLARACTHPSYLEIVQRVREKYGKDDDADTLLGVGKGVNRTEESSELFSHIDKQYMKVPEDANNADLATLGNSLLGLVAAEHLHLRYPNLPNRVLKAALSAYVGPTTLSDVAAELGLTAQGIIRWDRQAKKATRPGASAARLTSLDVNADAMRAVVAIIFQEQGLSAARSFIYVHLLSRLVPLLSLLKFNDPKRTLSELCKKLNKERPQSRLIAETGRLSINPIFVVGVWSGTEKIGEGTGSAIRMAEFRAAEDALRRFYMSETPIEHISLPSLTLDLDLATAAGSNLNSLAFRDIWRVGQDVLPVSSQNFKPAPIGQSEVIFGSKEK